MNPRTTSDSQGDPRPCALILAGGRSRRMGSNKLALEIDGATLLERTRRAAATVTEPVVIVGPKPDQPGAPNTIVVREDPPFGGPAAAIAAGIRHLPPEGVCLVLAADLADPASVVDALLAAEARTAETSPAPTTQALVLRDPGGRLQYLAGLYPLRALHSAAHTHGDASGTSVRAFLDAIALAPVDAPDVVLRDIDTPDDARAAGAVHREHPDTR